MNIAVIFAGGVGKRMHTKELPKQFLEVRGVPIIIHTLDVFQRCNEIDAIVVSCVDEWIRYLEELCEKYRISKIAKIVAGGKTGQSSIYNGLKAVKTLYGIDSNIVLIHDGVRPMITEDLIKRNIETVRKNGSSITCSVANETFVIEDEEKNIKDVLKRNVSRCAKAPQCFVLKDILEAHEKAINDKTFNFIDSCSLMNFYGYKLSICECEDSNIKITTPDDFYICRTLFDVKENQQLEDKIR